MDRLTYKHDDNWCISGLNGKLIGDKYANYWGEAIDRLAYYEDLEEKGRLIILPDDGMLYHIEESETMKWVGNKPIQNIIFKCGWGLASLEYSLWDLGRKFFFSREDAEDYVRGD